MFAIFAINNCNTQKYCLYTVYINYVLSQFSFFINVYLFNGLYRRQYKHNLITMIMINVIIVMVMTTIIILLVLVMINDIITIHGVVGYILYVYNLKFIEY